jgi:hypothetical protein
MSASAIASETSWLCPDSQVLSAAIAATAIIALARVLSSNLVLLSFSFITLRLDDRQRLAIRVPYSLR